MKENNTTKDWTLGSLVSGGEIATIGNEDSLTKAITIMKLCDYSQLPVVSHQSKECVFAKNIDGYISWKSIWEARAKGVNSNRVKDYKSLNSPIQDANISLMEAFKSIGEDDFVLVQNDKEICGIVTLYDIASHHMNLTKPFVLIEEIEKRIRCLLNPHVSKDLMNSVNQEKGREVNSLEDLTFGEYLVMLNNSDVWKELPICSLDKSLFIKRLDEVRKIRNKVMHFRPNGISEDEVSILEKTLNVLKEYA